MEILTTEQAAFYAQNGYLVLPGRIGVDVLTNLRAEIARFEAEAREMVASNDRLDLEDSHTGYEPRIRRVKRPDLISEVVKELLVSDAVLAPARDLLGPDIRMHTTKLNMKKAGYGAAIEWHQDFAFYPHTNDDVLAVGVIIDDIGQHNGPVMVFPGSHRGPIFDHHADGAFVGAMDLGACGLDMADAVPLCAPAGAITLHHGRIVHGSALNRSDRDRRLLFLEMMAADAFPIVGAMTEFGDLEAYNAKMLCGEPSITPRLVDVPVRIPLPPPAKAGSIYEIQDGLAARSFDKA